jgi:hypothetical protein
MSSFQHLDLAIDELELAAIQYADARRMAEFNAWPERYIKQMIQEMAETGQEELQFA